LAIVCLGDQPRNWRIVVSFKSLSAAFIVVLVMVVAAPKAASAGPIYQFIVSTGLQPANVGIITLTQVNANTVNVLVDLIDTAVPNPQYGFLNTGGPHTPFAFTLAGTEAGVTADFVQPNGPPDGFYGPGTLSLNLGGGDATPFGSFGVAIDSSAGNGSVNAYFGDLEFLLFRPTGLSTDDFIANGDGYFFAADLTNGNGEGGGNTGSQAWAARTSCPDCTPGQQSTVPEPASMLLLGTGLLAAARFRRRKIS
jgi:hypothetical protein